MKKILLLIAGLVASSASFANQPVAQPSAPQTHVIMTPEHKIKLYVQPLQTKGQVTILDANGQPVYTSNVALQKGLSQQFDLSNLSYGTYRLSLATGSQTQTKTFVVQPNPNESFVVQD
ncbi:T9SS type A sorting domain-containing protein [Spirosoma foliorum]|uniref:T9SS type A sorting domain-containing protein n=1 Tax=Spirosoma foliorum TaxID=2710596 RepID=A0A7G5H632_9BACT|nr:T9SS type A sorting domain-containing protein [Spirosoma foliorum]QMW06574.1 T9SS type A sorting domain-containing protein [Spirosoma foliorum]